jgi:hypothetical protein
MDAWDSAARGLLAEQAGSLPGEVKPFSPAGIGLAVTMFVAMVAVVARVGPHPFLLVMFLAFATLYFALVPARLLLRPLRLAGRKVDPEEAADLAEAAARSREAWEESASRAVAAWHAAREAALEVLAPLEAKDAEARAAAQHLRALVPPVAPRPDVRLGPGPLREAATTPLAPIPSLEGWGAVAGGVVYVARRKPFTLGEVLVVVLGVSAVPPSIFLAIDGAATVTACAVLPTACAQPGAGRNLFLLGMISLTGFVVLWRVVTRTRIDCPACGSLVAVPRLAPHGRCHGCGRRVWVQWRR